MPGGTSGEGGMHDACERAVHGGREEARIVAAPCMQVGHAHRAGGAKASNISLNSLGYTRITLILPLPLPLNLTLDLIVTLTVTVTVTVTLTLTMTMHYRSPNPNPNPNHTDSPK